MSLEACTRYCFGCMGVDVCGVSVIHSYYAIYIRYTTHGMKQGVIWNTKWSGRIWLRVITWDRKRNGWLTLQKPHSTKRRFYTPVFIGVHHVHRSWHGVYVHVPPSINSLCQIQIRILTSKGYRPIRNHSEITSFYSTYGPHDITCTNIELDWCP